MSIRPEDVPVPNDSDDDMGTAAATPFQNVDGHGRTSDKRADQLPATVVRTLEQTSALMLGGNFEETADLLDSLWNDMLVDLDVATLGDEGIAQLAWLLLSLLESKCRLGDLETAKEVAQSLIMGWLQSHVNRGRSNGLIVGNFVFHLLVARVKLALAKKQVNGGKTLSGTPHGGVDDVSRAVITAGIRILDGDDEDLIELRQLIDTTLRQPEGGWESREACECISGIYPNGQATEYFRHLFPSVWPPR